MINSHASFGYVIFAIIFFLTSCGGGSDGGGTTTDAQPNAFTFTDQTDVDLSTLITSNTITVSGITVPVSITISGGEYSVNGGGFVSVSDTVSNNDTVTVRHTSSSSNSAVTDTILTIGSISNVFSSTTIPATGSNSLVWDQDNWDESNWD